MTGTQADAIAAEKSVGLDLAREVRRQTERDRDPRKQELLDTIGPRLSARVANRHRTFSFELVSSPQPNAFALPGGFIFVTSAILELAQLDKDEVAFVLAHEMAHVIRGHAMERIVNSTTMSAVSRASPARGLLAAWLHRVGLEFLRSAYSQDQELEADRLGTLLATAAGYDPDAATRMLARLAKAGRSTEPSGLSSYLASHPAFELRIQTVRKVLKDRDPRAGRAAQGPQADS